MYNSWFFRREAAYAIFFTVVYGLLIRSSLAIVLDASDAGPLTIAPAILATTGMFLPWTLVHAEMAAKREAEKWTGGRHLRPWLIPLFYGIVMLLFYVWIGLRVGHLFGLPFTQYLDRHLDYRWFMPVMFVIMVGYGTALDMYIKGLKHSLTRPPSFLP